MCSHADGYFFPALFILVEIFSLPNILFGHQGAYFQLGNPADELIPLF